MQLSFIFSDSGLPPEFSSLLQQSQSDQGDSKGYNMARDGNLPEMKTFSQKQPGGPVTPYATTALLQAQNARKKVLTLVLDMPCFANSVDPDQLASKEAN